LKQIDIIKIGVFPLEIAIPLEVAIPFHITIPLEIAIPLAMEEMSDLVFDF
jgi:hypothetical protein